MAGLEIHNTILDAGTGVLKGNGLWINSTEISRQSITEEEWKTKDIRKRYPRRRRKRSIKAKGRLEISFY
jgi:hypothetical protein